MKSIIFALLLIPNAAFADYDVDWQPSEEPGIHILRIEIDSCTTLFKIKDKDFYAFVGNSKALEDALDKATARSRNRCK